MLLNYRVLSRSSIDALYHFSELQVDSKEERDLAAAICADGRQAQPPTCFLSAHQLLND